MIWINKKNSVREILKVRWDGKRKLEGLEKPEIKKLSRFHMDWWRELAREKEG